eukprot:7669786-Prorocentrum_lima.AAC.1
MQLGDSASCNLLRVWRSQLAWLTWVASAAPPASVARLGGGERGSVTVSYTHLRAHETRRHL